MPYLLILSFCVCYVAIFPILRKNADINFFFVRHFGNSKLNQTMNDSTMNQRKREI